MALSRCARARLIDVRHRRRGGEARPLQHLRVVGRPYDLSPSAVPGAAHRAPRRMLRPDATKPPPQSRPDLPHRGRRRGRPVALRFRVAGLSAPRTRSAPRHEAGQAPTRGLLQHARRVWMKGVRIVRMRRLPSGRAPARIVRAPALPTDKVVATGRAPRAVRLVSSAVFGVPPQSTLRSPTTCSLLSYRGRPGRNCGRSQRTPPTSSPGTW